MAVISKDAAAQATPGLIDILHSFPLVPNPQAPSWKNYYPPDSNGESRERVSIMVRDLKPAELPSFAVLTVNSPDGSGQVIIEDGEIRARLLTGEDPENPDAKLEEIITAAQNYRRRTAAE